MGFPPSEGERCLPLGTCCFHAKDDPEYSGVCCNCELPSPTEADAGWMNDWMEKNARKEPPTPEVDSGRRT